MTCLISGLQRASQWFQEWESEWLSAGKELRCCKLVLAKVKILVTKINSIFSCFYAEDITLKAAAMRICSTAIWLPSFFFFFFFCGVLSEREARRQEPCDGCLLQCTLRRTPPSIDIYARFTLPVIASCPPPPNQKFPRALYNCQDYAICRNLPSTHFIGENMPQLCLGVDDFLMLF